ncbi:hypothetical protein F5Y15DRAFT_392378 [Xylariaceae sp. FL0016]|nr:hypothetical protein F5Y15DRAFT_392378 [Xylariaceae sp. FL0016]
MSEVSKDDKVPAIQAENVAAAPAKKGQLKRFWCLYLLAFLAVATVIVVPCVILIAVPKMAQKKVNAAELSIDGIAVTNTQTNSLNMAINATIKSSGSIHAKVDSFIGTLSLLNVEPPIDFATIHFPKTDAASAQIVNVSQEIQIAGQGAFGTFNKYLLSSENVDVRVKGDTYIHVPGISHAYPVTFEKIVTFSGLNGFKGLSISDPQINLTRKNNFQGTIHIPNPSLLTLEVGNATFANFFNGSVIGNTTIDNLILYPGGNQFSAQAEISVVPVLKALLQEPYCENGILPIQLSGTSVINNGQSLPYFANALGAQNQTLQLNIGQAAKNNGFNYTCPS